MNRPFMRDCKTKLLVPRIALALILCGSFAAGSFADTPLQTGKPIQAGTDGGIGVFAPPSISCSLLGTVRTGDERRPDLIVASDHWHPGLYRYTWKGDSADGVPIFSQPIVVKPPYRAAGKSHSGYLLTDDSGGVYGFWINSGQIVVSKFDVANDRFGDLTKVRIAGLPRNASRIAVRQNESGDLEGFITVSDGTRYKPGDHRAEDYEPYDAAGIWKGGMPRHGIYRFECEWPNMPDRVEAELVLPPERGGLLSISSLEWMRSLAAAEGQLIFGTSLGGMYFVPGAFEDLTADGVAGKVPVTDPHGRVLRHPAVGTYLSAYPSADGKRTDLLAAGEGGMYYYRFADELGTRGQPVFEQPRAVLQESAELYGGSLVVPNVTDWNGDGRLDIVAGNAGGQLLFFENQGTDADPQFAPAVPISAGGEPIRIRGGYRGSIQGPGEGHWGYTCPTVVDWNGDGLSDVVMNDIRGMHTVYLNRGTPKAPDLAPPQPLFVDALELHGTWRTRPAAGMLGDRMAYVTLDDDDQLHLYWRIDDFNLEDAGKLLLDDGSPIQANFLPAGGTGRAKFQLVDVDRDGKVDLLVGTPRHAAFPEPNAGVPWSLNRAGSAVLLLRNVGTNEHPQFSYPAVMAVDGQTMHFGQHSCAPVATKLGRGDADWNLVVGTETGRMIFFSGADVEWKTIR